MTTRRSCCCCTRRRLRSKVLELPLLRFRLIRFEYFSLFSTLLPCNLCVFQHHDSRQRGSDGSFARPQAVVSIGGQQQVWYSTSFAIKQRRCSQSRRIAAAAAMTAHFPSERCTSIAVTSHQLMSTSTKRAPPPTTSSASCEVSRAVRRTKQIARHLLYMLRPQWRVSLHRSYHHG